MTCGAGRKLLSFNRVINMQYIGVIYHSIHQNNQKIHSKICFAANLLHHYPLINNYSILTCGAGRKLISFNRVINMQYIGVSPIYHSVHQNNQKTTVVMINTLKNIFFLRFYCIIIR